MSLGMAHPPHRSCQERLTQDFFSETKWRPIEALDGVDLLAEIECHVLSQVATKKVNVLLFPFVYRILFFDFPPPFRMTSLGVEVPLKSS